MQPNLKHLFLLDPNIHYMNHGSFGACPRPVFEDFQNWQLELEKNPIDYFTRQVRGLFTRDTGGPLEEAREALARFVNADSEGLIFSPNVTVALNAIAFATQLEPGDEVLTTNHEYGTIQATWERKCKSSGALLRVVPLALPVTTQADLVELFWEQVNPRTKVILLSHITSATALILPVEDICHRARQAGIITIIDGAHGVGQLNLDIEALQADFYTSNCHKWLLTPKGTAFLHVHPSQRESFEPMVVSWAEINQPSFSLRHEMWGTRDMAAFLSIPKALAFREQYNWPARNAEARSLVIESRIKFADILGSELLCDESWLPQMASVLLPEKTNPLELWNHLWDDYSIEAMITRWQDKPIIRLGFNAYNTPDEMDLLLEATSRYLQQNALI